MLEQRFALRDDSNGRWSVIDAEDGSVVTVRGRTLVDLDEGGAHDAVGLLNMAAELRARTTQPSTGVRNGLQPFFLPIR